MSSLDDLGAWLESLVRDVAGELAKLDDARAQGPAYAQMVASPWIDWSVELVEAIVDETIAAARLRVAAPEDLRDQLAPALLVTDDPQELSPSIDLSHAIVSVALEATR